jgi:predicted GNAT superfamily acetyltransferase
MRVARGAQVRIREVVDALDLAVAVRLQREIWGFGDTDVVPVHVMLTAAHNGGLVLLASQGNDDVGMLFGFAGLTSDGQTKHCSHMTGVVAAARGTGVGKALKWAQRRRLLDRGVELVTWTFDPLEARNARFNLVTLGAWSEEYLENVYGELDDDLNRGLPSDRLLVRWELSSKRVAARAGSDVAAGSSVHAPTHVERSPTRQPLILAHSTAAGRRPMQLDTATEPIVAIEIPYDVQTLKVRDLPLAHAWRAAVREAFTEAFRSGYRATAVGAGETDGMPTRWYVLRHTGTAEG